MSFFYKSYNKKEEGREGERKIQWRACERQCGVQLGIAPAPSEAAKFTQNHQEVIQKLLYMLKTLLVFLCVCVCVCVCVCERERERERERPLGWKTVEDHQVGLLVASASSFAWRRILGRNTQTEAQAEKERELWNRFYLKKKKKP